MVKVVIGNLGPKGFFLFLGGSLFILIAALRAWNPSSLWYPEEKTSESQSEKWTRKTMKNNSSRYTDPLSPDLQNELKRRLKAATTKKIILFWSNDEARERLPEISRDQCGNCGITLNRSKIGENATSAVLFYVTQFNPKDLPSPEERNPNQLHIFSTRESGKYVRRKLQKFGFQEYYKFNATMTYRRDSDIYESYQIFVLSQILAQRKKTPAEILKLKTKTSIAMVSNCTPVMRLKIMRDIADSGFAVDLVGRCFPNSLPWMPKGDQKVAEKLTRYKFYFAIENSYHCKDYITEKLYLNAIKSLAVPVVFGATKEDYEAVLPKGSFIFVEDFSSIRELVNYLRYLDSNDTAYLQYFRWHGMNAHQMPQYGRQIRFCNLCRVLHGINIDDLYNPRYSTPGSNPIPPFTDGVARRVLPSLTEYFLGEENKECLEPNETRLAIYSKFWGT